MRSSCARRPLRDGAEERIAAAGMPNYWPVEIYVNPSRNAPGTYGVIAIHHLPEGTSVAMLTVGEHPPVEDQDFGEGQIAPGVATQLLNSSAGRVLRVVA